MLSKNTLALEPGRTMAATIVLIFLVDESHPSNNLSNKQVTQVADQASLSRALSNLDVMKILYQSLSSQTVFGACLGGAQDGRSNAAHAIPCTTSPVGVTENGVWCGCEPRLGCHITTGRQGTEAPLSH